MKIWILAISLMGLMAGSEAFADGNELLQACQSVLNRMDDETKSGDVYAQGRCLGTVTSVATMIDPGRGIVKDDQRACVPSDATNGQLVRVVVKFLKANPKYLNEDQSVLTQASLMRAYPCK